MTRTRARPSWSSETGRFVALMLQHIHPFVWSLVLRCEHPGFVSVFFQNPFWTAKGSTLELGHVRRGRQRQRAANEA